MGLLRRRLPDEVVREGLLSDVSAVSGNDIVDAGIAGVVGGYAVGYVESRVASHVLDLVHELAGSSFHGAYTWASWFYRRMARETATFTPEEAVRKLAGLPAERLGLADRGVLREGARADLAIFDPETFGETGTTFEPNSVARGMRHVIVNGVVTLRDGRLTGERGGEVLRSTG